MCSSEPAGGARDPLDLGHRIGADIGGVGGGAPLLAEVDAARQFAHEHEIDPVEHLRLDRRDPAQRSVHRDRAQVRIHAEFAPQRKERRLGAHRRIRGAPLRSADRAEQHRIGAPAQRERVGWQAVAVHIDRGATEKGGCEFELVAEGGSGRIEDAKRLRNDFGTDPVAAEHRNERLHARRCSYALMAASFDSR